MSNHNLSTENPSVLSPPKAPDSHLTPQPDKHYQPQTTPLSNSKSPLTSQNLEAQELTEEQLDPRFKQANKEALITLAIYGLYFVWWYVFAYYYGEMPVADYKYIFGLPQWFFYSCILGYPIFSAILWIAVRLFFKDLPLDDLSADKAPEATCTPLI